MTALPIVANGNLSAFELLSRGSPTGRFTFTDKDFQSERF
jgi:hypothetical protein